MRSRVTAIFMLVSLNGPILASKIYKWTDNNGAVHYTDHPPAAHGSEKSGSVQTLNAQGMVTRRNEVMTPEKAAEQARQKQDDDKLIEQHRRDNVLLKSFTTPSEVDLVRDRALEGIDSEIKATQLRKQVLEKHIAEASMTSDKLKNAKRPVPDELIQQIYLNKNELKRTNETIVRQQKAKDAIQLKAAKDKQRMIELQGTE